MTSDRHDLEDLFAGARHDAGPDADLTARVLADADAVQRGWAAPVAAPAEGWLSRSLSAIGGWQGAGGLAMAGITGLMIGVFATDAVDLATGGQVTEFLGAPDDTSLMPGLESLVFTAWEG